MEPTLEYVKSLDQFTEEGKDEFIVKTELQWHIMMLRNEQIRYMKRKKKRKKNST